MEEKKKAGLPADVMSDGELGGEAIAPVKKKKKRRWYFIPLVILSTVVGLIVLLLIVGLIYINVKLGQIGRYDQEAFETVSSEDQFFETDEGIDNSIYVPMNPEDVVWSEEYEKIRDDGLINIMLLGQDRRPGQGRARSDTMVLLSINPGTMEVSLISFLRDLYVDLPGDYLDNRLNTAYIFGGFQMLKETMYMNFGIRIDNFFEVDFERFIDVVDAVGGVDIELSAAEASIVGVSEGLCHLNGKQALTYARIRMIDSDFQRTGRQRAVIEAVFSKIRAMGLTEILDLLDVILPSLSTDMSNSDIISLVMELAPDIGSVQLNSYHVPPFGGYKSAMIRQMAVLVPDIPKIRSLLNSEYLPIE